MTSIRITVFPLVLFPFLPFFRPRSTLAVSPAVFTVPVPSFVSLPSALNPSLFFRPSESPAGLQSTRSACGKALLFLRRAQKFQPVLDTFQHTLIHRNHSSPLILLGSKLGTKVLYPNGPTQPATPSLLDRADVPRQRHRQRRHTFAINTNHRRAAVESRIKAPRRQMSSHAPCAPRHFAESATSSEFYTRPWTGPSSGWKLTHLSSKHVKKHTKPYNCTVCHEAFELKTGLNRHIQEMHDPNTPRYYCPWKDFGCTSKIAREGTKRSENLNRHVNTAHGGQQ